MPTFEVVIVTCFLHISLRVNLQINKKAIEFQSKMEFVFEFPNLFYGIDFELTFFIKDAAIPLTAQGHKLTCVYTFVNFQPTHILVGVAGLPISLPLV